MEPTREQAVRAALPGNWQSNLAPSRPVLRLDPDGQFILGESEGRYAFAAGKLTLTTKLGAVAYDLAVAGDSLTLSGGDLRAAMTFTRLPDLTMSARQLFGNSTVHVRARLASLLVITVLVVAARLLVSVLRGASMLLIYSEWGPLRYVYRKNKNRTRTIHLLALNMLKYVAYFTAFGFVLSELGVNVTAYLASLSVIGLAVGFGSQGLVQDTVTGFFLIFEGQFDVGDVVDTSAQIGVVQEIGLRTTRLLSYLGQRVVIPNRSIAVVANYGPSGLTGQLDVRHAPGLAASVRELATRSCAAVDLQFPGVFLRAPVVADEPITIGDLAITRVRLSLWPGQQWIVDQQLVPRLKTDSGELVPPLAPDAVTVFYHPVRPAEVAGARRRWPQIHWPRRTRRERKPPVQDSQDAPATPAPGAEPPPAPQVEAQTRPQPPSDLTS